MAHPFAAHRQTAKEHSRVGHITKHYAKGGAVHEDAKQDKKLIKKMMKSELHADGEKSKHRADRPKRAKGGKVHKSGKTVVNVITGHPGGAPPMAGPPMGIAPAAMPPAPPPMAAKPPMPMGPPPGAGMPPPGGPPMPMRAKGGRIRRADGGMTAESAMKRIQDATSPDAIRQMKSDAAMKRIEAATQGPMTPMRARGGGVKSIGMDVGTKVQHQRGKGDLEQMGRGKQVTFKSGGKVRSFYAHGGTVKDKTDPGVSDRLHMGEKFKASPMEIRANNSNTTNDPTIGRANRAMGGRTESPQGVAKATRLPGGSGGGEARLAKEHRAERR